MRAGLPGKLAKKGSLTNVEWLVDAHLYWPNSRVGCGYTYLFNVWGQSVEITLLITQLLSSVF